MYFIYIECTYVYYRVCGGGMYCAQCCVGDHMRYDTCCGGMCTPFSVSSQSQRTGGGVSWLEMCEFRTSLTEDGAAHRRACRCGCGVDRAACVVATVVALVRCAPISVWWHAFNKCELSKHGSIRLRWCICIHICIVLYTICLERKLCFMDLLVCHTQSTQACGPNDADECKLVKHE